MSAFSCLFVSAIHNTKITLHKTHRDVCDFFFSSLKNKSRMGLWMCSEKQVDFATTALTFQHKLLLSVEKDFKWIEAIHTPDMFHFYNRRTSCKPRHLWSFRKDRSSETVAALCRLILLFFLICSFVLEIIQNVCLWLFSHYLLMNQRTKPWYHSAKQNLYILKQVTDVSLEVS